MPETLRGLTRLQRHVASIAASLGRSSRAVRLARPVYERVLQIFAGGSGIPWELNGETFRIHPTCRAQLGHGYERAVAEFLRPRVRPGETCFDIGANVGAYVLQFLRWSTPGGRVVAFEPSPAAAEMLRRHVRMNRYEGRVEVVPAAVGAREGSATLFAAGIDGMSRLEAANPLIAAASVPTQVPLTTVDRYCELHGITPDWLVIDVEGHEADVLVGAERTIAEGRPRGVLVEFHPNTWGTGHSGHRAMRDVLNQLRLAATPVTGQRDVFAEHGMVLLLPR